MHARRPGIGCSEGGLRLGRRGRGTRSGGQTGTLTNAWQRPPPGAGVTRDRVGNYECNPFSRQFASAAFDGAAARGPESASRPCASHEAVSPSLRQSRLKRIGARPPS